MITAIFIFKENDILNPFLKRQISEAKLEDTKVYSWSIESFPDFAEGHSITTNHTVIFEVRATGRELYRIEGPFSTSQFEEALSIAKKMIS